MMKLVIVTLSINSPGANRLLEASEASSIDGQLILLHAENLVPEIMAADCVVFRFGPRSVDFLTNRVLPKLAGTHHYKNLDNALKAFSKVDSARILQAANVPIPKTWTIQCADDMRAVYPSVMKIANGNQGNGVYLLRGPADGSVALSRVLEAGGGVQQELVADANGSDKRLFVVGNRVVAAMRRIAAGDEFRANLHLGGVAKSYVPSEKEQAMAIAAVQSLGLEFAGVDIIGEYEPRVLEVNPSPGFAIEHITDEDIAGQIMDYLKGLYA